MDERLRVLLIEDEPDDAELILLELRRGGFDPEWQRVVGEEAFRQALEGRPWDVVLSDYVMPGFDGHRALEVAAERAPDVPFILVSGEIGDEAAVLLMKAGCADYVPKGNLTRLAPAIRRELREAEVRRQQREAQVALRFLSDASADFVSSLDYEETVRLAAERAVPHLADWCALDVILADGSVRRLARTHLLPGKTEKLTEIARRFPARPGGPTLAATVMRTGTPILHPTLSDVQLRAYAEDEEHFALLRALGASSIIAVPLVAHGRIIGALSLASTRRSYGEQDLATAEDFARRAALAVENARLFQRARAAADEAGAALVGEQQARAVAEAAQRRAALLAEASHVLSLSLDYEQTYGQVVRLPILALADVCAVALPTAAGCRLAALGAETPEEERRVRGLLHDGPEGFDGGFFAAAVLRTGMPLLVDDVPEAPDGAAAPALRQAYDVARRLGIRSFFSVPIGSRGRTLGAFGLASARPGRRYDERDVALGSELAERIGAALDNALLYREAHDAIRVRDDFLSAAAHELETPIATLKLHLTRLLRATAPRQLAAALAAMCRQADRLAQLVDDLLEVSRLGTAPLPLECAPTELIDVVREVAARFRPQLERAGCELQVVAEAPVRGTWDRSRLDQVVTNLLSNAIKFGAGRPIEVHVEGAPDGARLTVRDHGIGIDPVDLGRVFGRFERAVSARNYGGLGLGLFISREIVVAHGGRIEVESHSKEGSTFTVTLPRAPPTCAGAAWAH